MSRLQELLDELCPNGVEYKKIEDVLISLKTGLNPRQNFKLNVDGAKQPYITGKDIFNNHIVVSERTDLITIDAVELINKRACLEADDLLFLSTGTGTVGRMALINEYDGTWSISESIYALKTKKDTIFSKYLMYFLYTEQAVMQYKPFITKASVPHLRVADLMKVKLPVPPLEVQREIVQILDKFTLLTDELTDELTARKKQYEYYKHRLLFENNGNDVALEEVAFYSKDRIDASDIDEYTYVGVDNLLQNCAGKVLSSHVPTDGRLTKYNKEDILIGNIRPYLKKIWFADNSGGTNGDVLDIRVKDISTIIPRYLYYILSSEEFFNYDNNNSKGAKMPRGDKDAVMRFRFCVPAISEQMRIISILDKFDTINNDMKNGIPAEIEARKRQYEYYRDKLLSFKELEK